MGKHLHGAIRFSEACPTSYIAGRRPYIDYAMEEPSLVAEGGGLLRVALVDLLGHDSDNRRATQVHKDRHKGTQAETEREYTYRTAQ